MSLRSCATATLALSAVIVLSPTKSAVSGQEPAKAKKNAASESLPGVRFTDIRESAGINFVQDSTQSEEKYYLETMGTGVAWIDYDQDGLMDLYLVQSAATDAYKPARPLRSAL